MRRLLLLALVIFSAANHAADNGAPTAIVRTALSKPSAHVGETVSLELTILVPGWFTAPLSLPPSLDIAGAQVRLSDVHGANVVETIGGVLYAGIGRRYSVVPLRAGAMHIPSLRVDIAFADGARQVKTSVRSQPLTLQATIPARLAQLGYFIASPRYRLQQQLDRPLNDLRVGDAVVRTIVQRGEAMSAIQIPVLRVHPVDGVATYADDPVFEDLPGERETPDAARQSQRITYLLQRPGRYELPALEVQWLNTRSGKIETASLAPLAFDVAPAPYTPSATPTAEHSENLTPGSVNAAGALIHWGWPAGLAAALASIILRGYRLRRARGVEKHTHKTGADWQDSPPRRGRTQPVHLSFIDRGLRPVSQHPRRSARPDE